MTAFVKAVSGLPYSPLVSGDVNGDGVANDRAFIFEPSLAHDIALRDAMTSLIASNAGRGCLGGQLGLPAARNSCQGGWTTYTNARVQYGVTSGLLAQRRAVASLNIANPLAGLDALLHGGTSRRGWGAAGQPDQVLYYLQGFDARANRFLYQVNPRFGERTGAGGAVHAPLRLTLDVTLDLGVPFPRQQLENALNTGRNGRPGERLTVASIKARYARNVPSIFALVISEGDSLMLSRKQFEALQGANAEHLAQVDIVWTELATFLHGLGDQYDSKDALRRINHATARAWEMNRLAGATVRSILSPLQLSLLGGTAAYLLTTDKVLMRVYY